MKKSLFPLVVLCLFTLKAQALVYTLDPTPNDLEDLDHYRFFTWGLNWSLPAGETIVSAELSFTQIWDWTREIDVLHVHLLDTAPLGVRSWFDNQGGGDFFASSFFNSLNISHMKLGEWSDPNGGDPNLAVNVTFTFDAIQLAALQSYLDSAGPSGWGNFGFGLDPDCHYFNEGVRFTLTTRRPHVPEGGSTLALLAFACGGIALLRRKFRA